MATTRLIKTVTIAASGSVTDEIDLGGYRLAAIHMPAAWTAAAITFTAAPTTGGTFTDVHDNAGTEVSITTAASRTVILATDVAENLEGLAYIKLRSGTSATPVAQAAERSLTLVLKC